MIGADVAAALVARLFGHRLLAALRAIGGAFAMLLIALAAAGRLTLLPGLLTMLGLIASLLSHEHLSFLCYKGHRDASDV
jgi:ABC-type Fe3+-siderophore transport system permease subunit